jgi:predicted phosphodiesterase
LALSSSSLLLGDFNDEVGKEELARSLDAHVLITNGRHEFKAADRNGRFYLDPGSATGAWTIRNPYVDVRLF